MKIGQCNVQDHGFAVGSSSAGSGSATTTEIDGKKFVVYGKREDAEAAAIAGVGGNADTDYVVEKVKLKSGAEAWAVKYATGADGKDLKADNPSGVHSISQGDKTLVMRSKPAPFTPTGTSIPVPTQDPAKASATKKMETDIKAAGFGKDWHPLGFIKKGSDTERMLLKGTGYKTVQEMQKAIGVPADGLIGPATLKALAQKTGGTSFFKPNTDEVDVPKFFTAVSEKAMQQEFEDAGFKPVSGDASQWPTFAAAAAKEAGKTP